MKTTIISSKDILSNVIHTNYRVLVVLDRMGIKLGFGNKSIEQITEEYNINTGAFLIIINLFCNDKHILEVNKQFEFIPDFLMYLKNSHRHFLKEKIPNIQQKIKELVFLLHDSKAEMVESFYNKYIEEVTEHIEYENETVFPYIEEVYDAFLKKRDPSSLFKEYGINIYDEHHENIEDVLKDLKNILIRHLPQKEDGSLRRIVLQKLFELEADLFSHTRIEDEVLIPLVKELEKHLRPLVKTI